MPVTVTVMVPWTARAGSPSLSLTLKPTEMVPDALGVTDTVVPDVVTAALPADSVALSRVIGDSGYGLVAEDATSTLTVSPILAVSV